MLTTIKYTLPQILALIHSTSASSSCIPSAPSCRCDSTKEIIDCSDASLTQNPEDIPNTVRDLTLSGNNFSDDQGDDLESVGDLTHLRQLTIERSNIKTLSFDLFDNLDDLLVLKLGENNIESIDDDTFEWNPLKLETLELQNNKLKYIQHFLFYDLSSLMEINLSNNKIAFIHPHAFQKLTNLRYLHLDGNHLKTFNPAWIKPFKSTGIQTLNLKNNPWSCDCSNSAGREFLIDQEFWIKNVEGAIIICNAPAEQRKLFPDLDKTQGKDLTNTKSIMPSLPCSPPRIKGISKSSTIEAGKSVLLKCLAEGLPKPSIAWIAPDEDVYRFNNNNFEGVVVSEEGFLKIDDLKTSDSGDYICQATNFQSTEDDDDNDDNKNNNNVAQVKMNLKIQGHNDEGEFIDYDYKSEDNDLDEYFNPKSSDHDYFDTSENCPFGCQCQNHLIDCTYPSLDGSRNSKKLTRMPTFDRDTVLKSSTRDYYLDGNAITNIPSGACDPFGDSLMELRIEDNEVSRIDEDAWRNCDKLQMLSLRNNNIDRITTDMFTNMRSLENLVLDENNIYSIADGAFKNLDNLRWLYIRNTDMHSIHPKAWYWEWFLKVFSKMFYFRFFGRKKNREKKQKNHPPSP